MTSTEEETHIVPDRMAKIVVFDFERNMTYLNNLERELGDKNFVYCPDYILPSQLLGLTLLTTYRTYLNLHDAKNELYTRVATQNYDGAVALSNSISARNHGVLIKETVENLLQNEVQSVIDYGYKLWSGASRGIVIKHFPSTLQTIYNQEKVTIINRKYMLALKLDATTDRYNDRLVWGDSSDKSSGRVAWKLLPVWDDQALFFKIINIEHGLYMKLDVNTDFIGDRKAWGSTENHTNRTQWKLKPVKVNNEIVFYIINRQYNQGLKLGEDTDSYNDRLLWGNNDSVIGDSNRFGWYIKPWA